MFVFSRRGLLTAAGLIGLSACVRNGPDGAVAGEAGPDQPLAAQLDAAELDQLRTEFIGDASAVLALLDGLRLPQSGKYTIEIGSDEQPFGLMINFDQLGMRMLDETQHRRLHDTAVLMLALVGNAEWVAWRFPPDTALPSEGRLELAGANEFVDLDIKSLAQDEFGVQELLDALTAHPYPAQPGASAQTNPPPAGTPR